MTHALPPILATLVAALNASDGDTFLACLADDAIVREAGQRHVGRPAIRSWFETHARPGHGGYDITGLEIVDGEPVLAARRSVGAPGDEPRVIRFYTALEDGRVVALRIAP